MREVPALLACTSKIAFGDSPALMPSTNASAAETLWIATMQVGDELHLAAVAELAQVMVRRWRSLSEPAWFFEKQPCRRCAKTTRSLGLRLRAGAGERAVEQRDAFLLQRVAAPRPCPRSAGCWSRRRRRLCRSTTLQTACSAVGAGQRGDDDSGASTSPAEETGMPASALERRACLGRRTSKPRTLKPAFARLADIAEPMMPRPMTPTGTFFISAAPR